MLVRRTRTVLTILGAAAVLTAGGCAKKEAAEPAPAKEAGATTPAPADGGKIPITTASDEARTEFLQGRDMVDKLRITDSIAHFQKAVALDPHFAMAELSLSATAPTGTEFFDHLHKAVSLADSASNGEKLLILATEAGANNDAAKQKGYLDELVAAYPNDERAHFNLAGYWFGQQDFTKAIEHYRKATEIAPEYSSAYNLLGYAYRQNGDYASAEKAFQKYIELIPGDPNPYDSYAELLLKMGRFDDSIAQYRKALQIDPNFVNAHQGIAMDLLYQGKPAEAAAELATFTKKARNDGERRTALFALTVVHADGGKMAQALKDVEQQYALGEKTKDVPGIAGDMVLRGNILLQMGKADEARAEFEKALKTIEESDLSAEIKENNRRFTHYNLARVAAAKKDFATAKSEAAEFRKKAEATNNPNQVKLANEAEGIIALAEKDWDKSIASLQQANLQNPQNLYRICQAYQGKGDAGKVAEFCGKAADFNSLPNLPYAFVRTKARAEADKKS
jgi:tetratricopeptide (TPR) repeat protein